MTSLFPVCLVALALGAASVSAAERLSDAQMDDISAGALGLVPNCGGASMCGNVSLTSSSSSYTVTNPDGSTKNVTMGGGLVTQSGILSGLGKNGGSGDNGGSSNNGGTGGTTSTPPVVITLPRNSPVTPPPGAS
jgi:hypothetical protein